MYVLDLTVFPLCIRRRIWVGSLQIQHVLESFTISFVDELISPWYPLLHGTFQASYSRVG